MRREIQSKWLHGRIASLRSTRNLAVHHVLSRFLRSGRLALHPARSLVLCFPNLPFSKSSVRHALKPSGFTLIEVIVFIVIVSIAVVAILNVFARSVGASADPLIDRQSMAIAESLMEEISAMPFTYCDPDDANATSATSALGCASLAEAMGPEVGESRGNLTAPFDNINDYDGFSMSGIVDITGASLTGLQGYRATVSVTSVVFNGIPNTDALQISIEVSSSNNTKIRLDKVKARYAANSV